MALRQRVVRRNRAAGEPLREVFPFDQLHDEEGPAGGVLEAVDRGDVGMIERCQQAASLSNRARRSSRQRPPPAAP